MVSSTPDTEKEIVADRQQLTTDQAHEDFMLNTAKDIVLITAAWARQVRAQETVP